jgi:galactokinase
MKSIEDLKLTDVEEEIKKWQRHIYFEYNGEEQYVELWWEEDYGYEILSKELTDSFSKVLDAWHETTDELFESMLDDLSWKQARKGK